MLIDSHAHLFWPSLKADFDAVLDRAAQAGVNTIINIGTNLETSKQAITQKSDKVAIFSTIGIHPHDCKKYTNGSGVSIQQDINHLEELYQNNKSKIVAIGECGLDFHFQDNPDYIPSSISIDQIKDTQRALFEAQVDLAKKLSLPLVIHCRNAWNEILDYLKEAKGVLHCFSGNLEDTKKIFQFPLYISYAANITYPKNDLLRETITITTLERILIETDSPFLAPQSKRGQRNEPADVLEVAKTIAEIKGINLNQVAEQTTNNSKSLFNLSIVQ